MQRPHITFYDTSRLYYSGYYLNGLRELAAAGEITLSISNVLPSQLQAAIRDKGWLDILFAISIFKIEINGSERFFCIDAHDSCELQAAQHAHGFHLPLLNCVDCYFKVNNNAVSIQATPELDRHSDKIHGVSQFAPLRPETPFAFLRRVFWPPVFAGFRPGFGHNRPYAGYLADTKRRMRDIRNFESLQDILKRRQLAKDIDIFFITGFHRGEAHAETMRRRHHLMRCLSEASDLTMQIGFSNYAGLPKEYSAFAKPRLKQAAHMNTLARARVVIYTQGIESCISSKFNLAMALGNVMVGEPLLK